MQDTKGQADHLQIFASRRSGDVARFGADIVDDGPLQPRDQEMSAFVHHAVFDPRKSIEYHCTSAPFDIVDGCLREIAQGNRDQIFANSSDWVCHCRNADGTPCMLMRS